MPTTAKYKRQFQKLIVLLTSGVWDLRKQHLVGKLLSQMHPVMKREKYGSNALRVLAEHIQRTIPGIKLSADRLYSLREYGTKFTSEEVQDLLQAAEEHQTPLSWSHILYSLSVEPPQKRMKLLIHTIEQRGTAQDLMRKKLSRPQSRKSQGGQKLSVPQTLQQTLEQLLEHTQHWVDRCQKVWLRSDSPLIVEAEKSSARQRATNKDLAKRATGLLKVMKTLSRRGIRRLASGTPH